MTFNSKNLEEQNKCFVCFICFKSLDALMRLRIGRLIASVHYLWPKNFENQRVISLL